MNGICKELRHREHRYIRETFMRRERHSIRDHDLHYRRVFQALDGRPRKNTMRGTAIDIARALFMHNTYRLREGAGGIDLVVHNDGMLALNRTNDAHRLRNAVIAMAAFLYNSKWRIQAISKLARFLCKALVGRNDDEIT